MVNMLACCLWALSCGALAHPLPAFARSNKQPSTIFNIKPYSRERGRTVVRINGSLEKRKRYRGVNTYIKRLQENDIIRPNIKFVTNGGPVTRWSYEEQNVTPIQPTTLPPNVASGGTTHHQLKPAKTTEEKSGKPPRHGDTVIRDDQAHHDAMEDDSHNAADDILTDDYDELGGGVFSDLDSGNDDALNLVGDIDLTGDILVIETTPRPGIISTLPTKIPNFEGSNGAKYPSTDESPPFHSSDPMSTPTGQIGYPANTWPLTSTQAVLGVPMIWNYVPVRNAKFPFIPFSPNNFFYIP